MAGIAWGKILADAASGPNYDPLPIGKYDMQVTKVEVKTTKNGEVMFSYQAAVQTGPHTKRVLFGNLVVPGATAANGAQRAGFFIRDLKNLGLSQEFVDSQPQPDAIAAALVGRYFVAQVEQREWQGDTKNEIKRILKAPAVTGPPAPGGYTAPPAPAAPAAAPAPAVAPVPPAAPPAPAAAAPPAPAAAPAAPAPTPAAPAPAAVPAAAPPAASPGEVPTLPPSPFG
jgi:hypothetical protein